MNKLWSRTKSGPLWEQPIATPAGVFTAWWSEKGLYALLLPPQPPAGKLLLRGTGRERGETAEGTAAKMLMRCRENMTDAEKKDEVGAEGQLLTELLLAYLGGEKVDFSVLPLDMSDYTPFQVRVLNCLCRLAYGCLISYRQLAAEVGSPQAARAVGRVLAANRTPIVVPCHRVRCSDGRPGGFSNGKEWKLFLWWIEGIGRETSCLFFPADC